MVTVDRLRELLRYDHESGYFIWLVANSRRVRVGARAGYSGRQGRISIGIDGVVYAAARMAWLYMTGELPSGEIDHINATPSDDRWINLRDVPHTMNQQNRRCAQANNKTGLLGVCFDKNKGKFMAQIKAHSRRKFIGYFDTPNAAHAAYVEAKRMHHDGCTL